MQSEHEESKEEKADSVQRSDRPRRQSGERPQLLRDPQLAEFRAGKRRLVGAAAAQVGSSEAVYDGFEMATLAKEHALREGMGPGFIEEKIIPKLKVVIQQSEGRLKSFHLWPEFDPKVRAKGPTQRKGRGGRYPARQGGYEHKFGNTPIIFGGIEIGMMEVSVPWLLPQSWKGLGIPLNLLIDRRDQSIPRILRPQSNNNAAARGQLKKRNLTNRDQAFGNAGHHFLGAASNVNLHNQN